MSTSAQQSLALISAAKKARAESNAKVRYFRCTNKTSDSRTSASSSMTQTVRLFAMFGVHRNVEAENRATAGIAFQPQAPAVRFNDAATYAQSHSHAIGLIRDEGLKQPVSDVIRYSSTGVGDGNLQEVGRGPADRHVQLASR